MSTDSCPVSYPEFYKSNSLCRLAKLLHQADVFVAKTYINSGLLNININTRMNTLSKDRRFLLSVLSLLYCGILLVLGE